jgi:hypothetical protein
MLKWFLILLPISLLIHVYLFVMASIIAIATLLRCWRNQNISIKEALEWLSVFIISTFVIAVCCGYVHFYGAIKFSSAVPSGRCGMNILSPVTPSKFSPLFFDFYQDPTGKQFTEGMNYLGSAVIGLWLFIFIKYRRILMRAVTSHLFLLIIFSGLWVFSLSYKIYFGEHLLVTIPKIPGVHFFYQFFRGNGRFFWPIAYLFTLSPVIILWRHCAKKRIMVFILCAAVLVQNLEILNLRIVIRRRYSFAAKVDNISTYEDFVRSHDLVLLYEDQSTMWGTYRPIARSVYFYAGKYGVPTNYCYTARPQQETMTFDELVSEAIDSNISTLCVLPRCEYMSSELNVYTDIEVFDEMAFVSIRKKSDTK